MLFLICIRSVQGGYDILQLHGGVNIWFTLGLSTQIYSSVLVGLLSRSGMDVSDTAPQHCITTENLGRYFFFKKEYLF